MGVVEPTEHVTAELSIENISNSVVEWAKNVKEISSDNPSKPWMDYRCITDTSSEQYKLLQNMEVNEDGTVCVDSYRCVALGSQFGKIGSKYWFLLERTDGTRQTLKVIKADEKQARHTKDGQGWVGVNGHVLEMLVDTYSLDPMATRMGDCNYIDALNGKVISYIKIN